MENNLISVIIPAYNASRFIKETIDSVLQQSYSEFELIIVNDGSTDDTLQLVKEMQTNDARIKLFDKENEGVCKARNDGYKISKGEFILFLDADDVLDQSMFDKCISIFQTSESIKAIYTKGQIIDQNSKQQEIFLEAKTIVNEIDMLEWKEGFMPTPSCTLLKRSVVDNIGLWDPAFSTAADQDFFIRVSNFCSIMAIDEVLFYYRVHPNNMHQNISLMEKDHIGVFRKAEKNKLFKTKSFKNKCFSHLYLILAGSWWHDGKNKMKAIKFILLSIYYDFTIFRKLLKINFQKYK